MTKLLVVYWALLQSTLASFSGLSSLPVIRHEFVVERHWIDDTQLSAAVMIGKRIVLLVWLQDSEPSRLRLARAG